MAVFRLAVLLGKTVGEIDMSWQEFIYWQAYMMIEPPERPANQRTAALMAQITNMSGKSLKDGKTMTADDFLGGRKGQSMADQIAYMKGIDNGN